MVSQMTPNTHNSLEERRTKLEASYFLISKYISISIYFCDFTEVNTRELGELYNNGIYFLKN